jgi:tRNA-specific 2-thiouridylase
LDAIFDAKNVANSFGFPHYTVDFTGAFEEAVIENFVDEYLKGRTPNPCVVCNRKIKWEELLKKADALDAKYVATGHYAEIIFDETKKRYSIKNSIDNKKDQSYALWGLTQESLSRTLLPLGKYTKPEIRKLAEDFGLKTANKPDSQEICFVADNNYERFLRERIPDVIDSLEKGEMVYKGEKINDHKGLPFYTVGQRKGLGVAVGKPIYVKKIDHKNNRIEVGDKADLLETILEADDLNYLAAEKLNAGQKVFAKIRYSDKAAAAEINSAESNFLKLTFAEPKNAITPGQSVVIYNEHGVVLAGGVIKQREN